MAFGFDDAIAIAMGLGSMFSGAAQGQATQQGLNNQAASPALGAIRQFETSPERDRALYLLNARMGLPYQPLQFSDMYNPTTGVGVGGTPNLRTFDPVAYQQAQAAYKLGMGGAQPGMVGQVLNKLGVNTRPSSLNPLGPSFAYNPPPAPPALPFSIPHIFGNGSAPSTGNSGK